MSANTLYLYGLKTCDTCRKARRALEGAGYDVQFRDLRELDDFREKIAVWLKSGRNVIINKSSATWRGLSATDKARAATNPAALLAAHPALIKRPVIEKGRSLSIGWSRDVQALYINPEAGRLARHLQTAP
jgi:arsenate reductase